MLIEKLRDIAFANDLNIAWLDEKHQPDKKWLVDVIASMKPEDEIFKDYRPPPIRKRLQDYETIVFLTSYLRECHHLKVRPSEELSKS